MYRRWSAELFKDYIKNTYPHIDTSNMNFINIKTKVELFCTKHNHNFTRFPSDMIYNYSSCPLCGDEQFSINRSSNTEKFKKKAEEKYPNNEFDFSKVNYVSATDYVTIICNTCHKDFNVTPNNFFNGRGCPHCKPLKLSKIRLLPFEDFENEANEVHNFKYIYFKETYINRNTDTKIYCPKHDIYFWQTPQNHLKGERCSECANESMKETKRMPFSELKQKFTDLYGDRFTLNESDYIKSSSLMKIHCNECNTDFYQYPYLIINNGVVGCECTKSIGEKIIKNYLIQNNIEFITQHRFNDCRDIEPLPFDFYIPTKNLCIEYDGIQHFKPIDFFGGNEGFEYTKKHDNIKNEYCCTHNIELLRIPYNKNINKIKKYLEEYFKN